MTDLSQSSELGHTGWSVDRIYSSASGKTSPVGVGQDDALYREIKSAKRSESHWNLDGSIVVLVQKTLFRLHRSSLVKQSRVFEEAIMGINNNDRVSEIFKCPVIRMDGNADEFEAVLDALQDGL